MDPSFNVELYFKSNYERLVNMAYSIIRDQSLSEDVVQDVFINILSHNKLKHTVSHADHYITKAVINRCKTIISTKTRFVTFTEAHLPDFDYQSRNDMVINEFKKRLEAALQYLPPRCRLIFCLSKFEGMQNTEIAEYLNISKRTVDAQLVIALTKLREQLKPYLHLFVPIALIMLSMMIMKIIFHLF